MQHQLCHQHEQQQLEQFEQRLISRR